MADLIRMPAVLAGASEAAIQTWLVAPGTAVEIDQTLAELETDKAIVEFTAEIAGTVGALLAAEGDAVAVGVPLLVLLADGEGEAEIALALAAAGAPVAASVPFSSWVDEATTTGPHSRIFRGPLVRRLAAHAGVDLSAVAGSGPRGRVVRRDLERHLASAAAPEDVAVATPASPGPGASDAVESPSPSRDYEDVPLDRMRRTIARRLTESKAAVPHFYLEADCRVDALMALRATVNESAPRKISVNDFVVKAAAEALVDVPAANAIWNGDSIRRFSSVDMSIAVAVTDGLVTPVIRSVERMTLGQLSATAADLAERARRGRLSPQDLEGGSFSISNLGMYGTSRFAAILNPPQSGILAVGAARKTPLVGTDGALAVGTVMSVTLSADHRVVDGALAAQWLAAFQRRIENPLTILI